MIGRRSSSRLGFSLIEALVALAIASMGLIAIFSLQQQLVDGQRRYEKALVRAQMRRNILSALRDVNPIATPTGRLDLPPNQQLRWTSQPRSPLRQNTGVPSGDGAFQVQLFTVTAQIADGAGHPLEQISFDRLGWRRTAAASATSAQPPGQGAGQTATLPGAAAQP